MMHFDDSESSTYYCRGCQAYHSLHVPIQYNSEMICIHPSYAWSSAPLPRDSVQWDTFSRMGIVEYKSLYYLSIKRVINWCSSLSPLYPLATAGDGNCLMNAVSLFIRARQDTFARLRQTVYRNLSNHSVCAKLRKRWQSEREWQNVNIPDGGLCYTDEEWDREWNKVVNAATTQLQRSPYVGALSYEYLEEIHVFTLANVLRRPIVVLGEPFTYDTDGDSIEQNNFVGVYLPLLCSPSECYPMPVVIAFIVDHFQPLLLRARSSLSSEPLTTLDAVPLVTADLEPLRIHFLLPDEQGCVANSLLQQYLYTFEVKVSSDGDHQMVLCARLYNSDEDKHIHNLIAKSESSSVSPGLSSVDSSHQSLTTTNTRPSVPEDRQCSRLGCSQEAVMKPPAALVLLPLANKNKVLTYCRDRSLQCSRSSLKSSATSVIHFCCEHAPSGSTELDLAPVQHQTTHNDVVAQYRGSQSSADDTESMSEDLDNVSEPRTYLILLSSLSERNSDVEALCTVPRRGLKSPDCDSTAPCSSGYCISCQKKQIGGSSEPALCDKVKKIADSELSMSAEVTHVVDDSTAVSTEALCRGPYCHNVGLEQLRGLCMTCYRTLLDVNFNLRYSMSADDVDVNFD